MREKRAIRQRRKFIAVFLAIDLPAEQGTAFLLLKLHLILVQKHNVFAITPSGASVST
jgi:hypothetical protein